MPDQTARFDAIHLNTVHRDIRVAAPGVESLSGTVTPRIGVNGFAAAAFADRLARRYAGARGWRSGAERILRRLASSAITQAITHRYQIVFRPRLSFAVRLPDQHAAGQAARAPAADRHTDRPDLSETVQRGMHIARLLEMVHRVTRQVHETEQRLTARTQRLEARDPMRHSNGNAAPMDRPTPLAMRATPVPQVVVQAAPAEPPASRPNRDEVAFAGPDDASHMTSPTVPPLDQITNALTDHVLDAIEQRLIAHRERMGRG